MKKILTLVAFLCCASGALAADEGSVKLKEGAARELVVGNCVMCHSLDYIPMNSPFLDRKGWDATITKMVKVMGAPIKPDDHAAILEYLAKNYGNGK